MWHWSTSSKIFNLTTLSVPLSVMCHVNSSPASPDLKVVKTQIKVLYRNWIWSLKLLCPLWPHIYPHLAYGAMKSSLDISSGPSRVKMASRFLWTKGVPSLVKEMIVAPRSKPNNFSTIPGVLPCVSCWHSLEGQDYITKVTLPQDHTITRSTGWKGPVVVSKSSLGTWSWTANTGQLWHCTARSSTLQCCTQSTPDATPCFIRSQICRELLYTATSPNRADVTVETV